MYSIGHEPTDFRIMVVDDHPIVRQALASLINLQPDLKVCAEASSAADAIRLAAEWSPDAAIVDISLAGTSPIDRSGLELIRDLCKHDPPIPSLVLSMYDESIYALRVLRAGGRGYIMKQHAHGKVVEGLRRVLTGDVYLSAAMRERLPERLRTAQVGGHLYQFPDLSDRELEVLALIGGGLGNGEIAQRMSISRKTVETHKQNLQQKLNLKSAHELLHCAVHRAIEKL